MRWADNVVEESTTTTTGAYQLGGVPAAGEPPGAQTFVAGIGDTQTCYYYAKEMSGTAWERGIGTVADAATDTLTRTTIHGSSNGGSAVDWTGKTLRVYCVNSAYALRRSTLDHAGLLDNATFVATRSSGAETIHLKTLAGTDPSPTDPVRVGFAKTDGTFDVLEVTAALSLTLSSGSTLGATSAQPFRIWVTLFNDAGTVRLGLVKCALADGIRGLFDNLAEDSTAEGGAGGADTAGVIYTGTAVTAKTIRVLGYLEYTLTTAGTWDTAPSLIKLWSQGGKLPGDVVQEKTIATTGVISCNVIIPYDDTIPQNTEGAEAFTLAISPRFSTSIIEVVADISGRVSATSAVGIIALFKDSGADALITRGVYSGGSDRALNPQGFIYRESALSTAARTFKLRAGLQASGSYHINGSSTGSSIWGGTSKSGMHIKEIMV